MYKIGLVEDERDLNELITSYLKKDGYEVVSYTKGSEVISNLNNEINLWILDIMLEDDISGFDIVKKIRETDKIVPVIFTSARDHDLDKIMGLELGSDDYITKPYSPKELMLRVSNMIRRIYNVVENNIIKYDDYIIDVPKRMVYYNEEEILLTTLEFDFLLLMVKNRGKVLSREFILNTIWGENYYGSDRVVDDLVRRVRKKTEKLQINTVYGYGYRLL